MLNNWKADRTGLRLQPQIRRDRQVAEVFHSPIFNGRRKNEKMISMKTISVVGAGLMGHGIATVFALGGYTVTLHNSRRTLLPVYRN